MNRATDEDVRVMVSAYNVARNYEECLHSDAMRAAAEALLSRRMPTREALNAAVARACQDGETYLGIADAIADLFGVTD